MKGPRHPIYSPGFISAAAVSQLIPSVVPSTYPSAPRGAFVYPSVPRAVDADPCSTRSQRPTPVSCPPSLPKTKVPPVSNLCVAAAPSIQFMMASRALSRSRRSGLNRALGAISQNEDRQEI
jgi:hypothetical protein